jgi:hypothetical protein
VVTKDIQGGREKGEGSMAIFNILMFKEVQD